jgi:PAS domain S-box-containing protein
MVGAYHASLIEAMPDAVVGTDADFRVTVWNPAAERLYGFTAEQAMGRPVRELTAYEGDVEVISTAVHDDTGAVVGHVGIHRDVTERKQAEEERRRLSAIVQNSNDFIGMADLEGNALFLNDAGQRLVGLRGMDEVRATKVIDFFAPEIRDRVRDEMLPHLLAGGRRAWDLDFVNFETGERIPVSWDGFRVDDPETGEPIALATITRDLSERRRSEAELQAYRRRIDTIFASINDGFCAVDRDFRFAFLNDRAMELIAEVVGDDLQRGDLLGNDVFAMLPELAGTTAERKLRAAMRDQRPVDCEAHDAPRGRWFDFHVDPSDEGLAISFRDITDRKLAEQARDRQTRQQAAVAELGVRSWHGETAVELMDDAVAVVSRTLGVELVAVAEDVPEQDQILLRAGVGWQPGRAGHAHFSGGRHSLVGDAMRTGEPLVCDDVATEMRCEPSALFAEHDVTSAAVVAIPGRRTPFGAFGVFSRRPRRFGADEVNFLVAIANVLSSAIERAQTAQRVRDARDAERRRIARALHDETLQDLGIALALAGRAANGTGAVDGDLTRALRGVGEQIRAAIHDLRLSDQGERPFSELIAELVDVHRAMARRCAFHVDVADDVPERLPGDMGTEVLRVIGEALTNARRHASPCRVDVGLRMDGGALVVTVADDGRGFDAAHPDATGGHGIAGMHERAELLGGRLTIARRAEGGTAVELRAPVFDARPAGDQVRVLLVDDHAAIREALALAFADDDGFVVAGQAGTLAEARTMLGGIDVAIIDLALPDGYGADLIAPLRAASPQAQALVLSAAVDRAATARAVEKGAAAVLSKTTHLHQVVGSVRRLRAGETLIPLEEMVELLRFAGLERERELDERRLAESLTAREREVLQLLADGLDSRQVAERLHITPRTQRNHMANILSKLRVHSQLQALVFALRHGVVDVPRVGAPADPAR